MDGAIAVQASQHFRPVKYISFLNISKNPLSLLSSYQAIMSFSTIPILDLSLAKDPSTKPQFLNELRHALLEVGFLYLKNVGIPEELTQAIIKEGVAFFDLPMDEKFVLAHINNPITHLPNPSIFKCSC